MKTILLVDDEEINLIANQPVIEKNIKDITCDTARTGKEAIAKFKANNYNIIILDMVMEEMDGFETAAAITKYCTEKDIKPPHIISYTILEDTLIQSKAIEAGITDYVGKGDHQSLINMIEKWIMFDESLKEYYGNSSDGNQYQSN